MEAMDVVGTAKRVRIYLNEDDRIGRMSASQVLVEFLRRENAQGATVLRGVEGFGATGEIHVSHLPEIARKLPVIVEWIDVPERVERLLPRIIEMVPRGLVTMDQTEIVLYEPHPVRQLPAALTAGDVMSREVTSVGRDTPVRRVVELMLGKVYRTVPVVDGGVPVGIVSNGDLVQRGGLGVRLDLLRSLDEPAIHSVLERLSQGGKVAADVMTPGPVTVHARTPLPKVAELMSHRRLKRLPVVDDRGALVGMVSRVDLLRTAAGGFPQGEEGPRDLGFAADMPLSRVMRRDVPVVHPDTSLPEVFQAIISTRLNRALVVDGERRVLGLVTDAELIDRLAPSLRPGALRSLMHRLPFGSATPEERVAEGHARARRAADLMTTGVPTAREDALLGTAIAAMLKGSHKVLAVVDAESRLVGIVDRADVLRGLVPWEA
jgi:CBS domain-containing protein